MRKQIGTDQGIIEGECYLDPFEEMREYVIPAFYLIAEDTILSTVVCWTVWANEHRN